MSRRVLTVVVALAAVAVMGVSASSAFATETAWWVNGAALKTGETAAVSGTLTGTATLKGVVGTNKTKIDILCTEATLVDGELKGTNTDTSSAFNFKKCTVSEPVGCKVKGEIVEVGSTTTALVLSFKYKVGSEEKELAGKFDMYTPTSSEGIFATIKIEGCAAEGTYKVTGTAACTGEEKEAVVQPCKFEPSVTSKTLKFGGEPAEFSADFLIGLTGARAGQKWEIRDT